MTRTLLLILALFAAPRAGAQSAIDLRPTARVPDGARVTLGLVAALRGPEAQALAQTPIAAADAASVSLDDIRVAVDATGRINWGRLALSGSTCTIIRTAAPLPAPAPPPAAESPAGAAPPPADQVRSLIAQRLATLLRAGPDDLRLTFDDADRDLLDTSIGPGRSAEVTPVGTSDRTPIAVTIYQGERPVMSRTVRVAVLVRRTVAVAQNSRRRGDLIGADDYRLDTQWVGPTLRFAPPERIQGFAVRSHLVPGRTILAADVEPPIVVDKGEIVDVRVVAGTVVLRSRARAATDGRQDQVIEFRALDSKRTFLARIDGPGLAVAVPRAEPQDAQLAADPAIDSPEVVDEIPGPTTINKPGLTVTRTNPPAKAHRKDKPR